MLQSLKKLKITTVKYTTRSRKTMSYFTHVTLLMSV